MDIRASIGLENLPSATSGFGKSFTARSQMALSLTVCAEIGLASIRTTLRLSRTKKTFGAFARIPISRTGRAGMRSESQSTRPRDAGFFPSIGLWRVSKRTRFRQGWRVRLRIGHGQVPHRQAKTCPTAASHSADSLSRSLGRLTRIADMSQFNPSTDRSPLTPRGSEGPIAVTKSTRIGPPAVNLTPMPHRHIVTGCQLSWTV